MHLRQPIKLKESYTISIPAPMIAAVIGFSFGVVALHYFGKRGALLGFILAACLGWIIDLQTRRQQSEK